MSLLGEYLRRMREIRATGHATGETSYYTPLENLLTSVGATLTPKVTAASQLSMRSPALTPSGKQGRALPDFGFYVQQNMDLRGLIEAKPAEREVTDIAKGTQIATYLNVVPAVLITNFRAFLFVTRGASGEILQGPSYTLASSAEEFWNTPIQDLVRTHEAGLRAYLADVLHQALPITTAGALAGVLARYATEARTRITSLPDEVLTPLRTAMTEALGITFQGAHGEEFFRSTLIQTVFYGLFSAWILWVEAGASPNARFEWAEASPYLNVAVVGALFEALTTPRRLRALNLEDTVRWAIDALNRIERDTFFADFDQQHAIQYFYEPFLEAYDPALREQLGVWYTPPEIVAYQVSRIDQLLREELGVEAGLADDSVVVLDPCTGTGSYLREVARCVHERLQKQDPSLAAARTKRAIRTRLIGFEIMPAPFVIAHLQMGRFAAQLGSGFGPNERAAIYLTNALTGWEGETAARQPAFPELADEREAADNIKRRTPILVVLGNPPYYRYASMSVGDEAKLIAPYKDGLYRRFKVRKSTLDDLYIRFYRLAEWRIAEHGQRKGIVSFISNWSWLAGSSFPVMREHFVREFDTVRIDNLGGGVRGRDRRSEVDDESVFSTATSPGISLGVAISFLVTDGTAKTSSHEAAVWYRRQVGSAQEKRSALVRSVSERDAALPYVRLHPTLDKKWVLRPAGEAGAYDDWLGLPDVLPKRYMGVNENRGGALIAIDRQPLEDLRAVYMNKARTHDRVIQSSDRARDLMASYARYDARKVRDVLLRTKDADEVPRIVRFASKAFDDRYILWGGDKLLNEKRREFLAAVDADVKQPDARNVFLVACENARIVYDLPGVTVYLGDLHYQDPWAQFFPLRHELPARMLAPAVTRPNLSERVLTALAQAWGIERSDPEHEATADELAIGEAVFYHVLATMHTPEYRDLYSDALASNWARIPIPLDRDLLLQSAGLGRQIASLLRTDCDVEGVTRGNVPTYLLGLARPRRVDGHPLRDPDDLEVTFNYRGEGKRVTRTLEAHERSAFHGEDVEETNDIYWNPDACWTNVPSDVWEFQIGGFPVLKKWLEERKESKLGRPLTLAEVTEFTLIARRCYGLLQLGSVLDECHEAVTAAPLVSSLGS